jgi:hypothetical protein
VAVVDYRLQITVAAPQAMQQALTQHSTAACCSSDLAAHSSICPVTGKQTNNQSTDRPLPSPHRTDTSMAFSSFLKIFALLALLTLDVGAAGADQARSLRIEPSAHSVEQPETRQLSGKNPVKLLKIITKNIKNQPVIDKAIENAKKVKYYVEHVKNK